TSDSPDPGRVINSVRGLILAPESPHLGPATTTGAHPWPRKESFLLTRPHSPCSGVNTLDYCQVAIGRSFSYRRGRPTLIGRTVPQLTSVISSPRLHGSIAGYGQ